MLIPELIEQSGPFVSLEFFPPRKKGDAQLAFLDSTEALQEIKPLFYAITCGAGGGGARGTTDAVRYVSDRFDTPVMPHMTCVGNSPDSIRAQLREYSDMGVRNVLAVRGDLPSAGGGLHPELQYASDMLSVIRSAEPRMSVGVACYADPHPESATIRDDVAHQQLKFEQGAGFGITQLFFDNRRYFDLVARLEEKGCCQPVIPSVLPIRTLAQIKRLMQLCDVAIPGTMLGNLEKAHVEGGDEAVTELGIRYAVEQINGLLAGGAPGVHLYPFNRVDMVMEIVRRSDLPS